jgi:hypothetical protein
MRAALAQATTRTWGNADRSSPEPGRPNAAALGAVYGTSSLSRSIVISRQPRETPPYLQLTGDRPRYPANSRCKVRLPAAKPPGGTIPYSRILR